VKVGEIIICCMWVGRRFDFGNLTPKPERILIALAIMQILGC
jgi:hypothetical protein